MAHSFNSPTRLARARRASLPGSSTPHTVVLLPSYSVSDSMLVEYGHRIPALEHRQLLSLLMLPRVPAAQIIFVTSLRPARQVLDYYLSLVPPERRRDMRARIRILEVSDPTRRSVTAKLLDRPDLIAHIRRLTRGRLAFIEPWNVTELEMEVARQLRLPLNGTVPELWPLGFKSSGRRLMRSAGVRLPLGQEDVRSVDGVVAAAEAIRRQHPDAIGVVIKTDNSGTGNGNRIIRFPSSPEAAQLRDLVEALEPWYLADVALGAVVEELVVGAQFASPSVQVDIAPGGQVEVLSTHEQLLGGPHGQVYIGCRFPAASCYSRELASYGEAVGRELAAHGAMGRFSVDFAAAQSVFGKWELYGLEVNLRKSGTNHPLSVLHSLAPGQYDATRGRWLTVSGSQRCYRSTDNLVDPSLWGRAAEDVITAVRSAGLEFNQRTQTGVVLHMFSGLDIDGRLGLTAIGRSPGQAERLYHAAVAALSVPAAESEPSLPA